MTAEAAKVAAPVAETAPVEADSSGRCFSPSGPVEISVPDLGVDKATRC